LVDENRYDDALELLAPAERELVARILFRKIRPVGNAIGAAGDTEFLGLARLRLRNLVEKHSEALKRARLAARSDGRDTQIPALAQRLWICSEALTICSELLRQRHTQDRGGLD